MKEFKRILSLVLLFVLLASLSMDSQAAWKRYKGDRWKFTVSSENTVRKKYVKNKWKRIDGKYFYFDSKGWLKTGRIKVKKKWYYCDYEKGRISNQWVGAYYYGKNGVMVRNQWVGMYYVGKNGKKVPGKIRNTKDVRLLSAITYLEAGNQSYEGKLAVANVILNRVHDSSFPDTIQEVVYQSGQFTPAMNGMLSWMLESGQAVPSECIKAAKDALSGVNNVPGYLYFTTGVWGPLKIGDHYFRRTY